jgi:hypothetical protein
MYIVKVDEPSPKKENEKKTAETPSRVAADVNQNGNQVSL